MFRYIMRKLLRVLSKTEIKEQQLALGINSYIDKEHDKHMLMLDYDTLNLKDVFDDVKELCEYFKLSSYEIYRTEKGFHVFFWYDNSLPYSRVKMIIDFSRCDVMYKYISKFYDYKTVRAGGKYRARDIQYVGIYSGVRKPTSKEKELGDLKREEYRQLKKIQFNEKFLK